MSAYIIVTLVAYLLGSISFSVIISKKMAGFDVREKGSGNAGATNMLRSVGKKGAIFTLIGDCLKGVVAILFAIIVGKIAKNTDKALLVQLAGIAVVLGHTFPIFFGFKGGKGVATSLGVLLMTNWQIGLICLVFALVLMALSKMVSLGSVGAAILFPVLVLFIHTNFTVSEGSSYLIYSIILAVIALVLVLGKGHVFGYALVSTETGDTENKEDEIILPKLTLEIEKEFLSSKNKKETSTMTVSKDGEIITEGVEFESSNEDVVEINEDNELEAVSDGKATIKAKYDGLEATADIRVITPIKSMSFTTTNKTIRVGKDLQMKLKLTPSNASTDTLTYTSSDEEIATVNSNGIVTGVAPGKVTITIYDSYTDTEKSVNLTIRK